MKQVTIRDHCFWEIRSSWKQKPVTLRFLYVGLPPCLSKCYLAQPISARYNCRPIGRTHLGSTGSSLQLFWKFFYFFNNLPTVSYKLPLVKRNCNLASHMGMDSSSLLLGTKNILLISNPWHKWYYYQEVSQKGWLDWTSIFYPEGSLHATCKLHLAC